MALGKGAKKEVQSREAWLQEVEFRANIAKQKPSIVLAVPHTEVKELTVEWRQPTHAEMVDPNKHADAVLEIFSKIQQKSRGRHGEGKRMLLQKLFSLDVDDALEFGEVGQGVNVLFQAGAFTERHIAQIADALKNPPENIKACMDTRSEIKAWQSQVRPARTKHSVMNEWVKPTVNAVIDKISFIKK